MFFCFLLHFLLVLSIPKIFHPPINLIFLFRLKMFLILKICPLIYLKYQNKMRMPLLSYRNHQKRLNISLLTHPKHLSKSRMPLLIFLKHQSKARMPLMSCWNHQRRLKVPLMTYPKHLSKSRMPLLIFLKHQSKIMTLPPLQLMRKITRRPQEVKITLMRTIILTSKTLLHHMY